MARIFEGKTRKVAIIPIAAMALPWFLVVITFGIASFSQDTYDVQKFVVPRASLYSYPYWMVCFCGPVVMACALLQAALWKPLSTVMGAVLMFFSVLYISAMGLIVFFHGLYLHLDLTLQNRHTVYLGLVGAILGLLSITMVLILGQFYDFKLRRSSYETVDHVEMLMQQSPDELD